MDAENKKYLRVDVDMSRLRECVDSHFVALVYELDKVSAEMASQLNIKPEHKNMVIKILTAQGILIAEESYLSVVQQAKEGLVGVTKVDGRVH